MTDEVDWAGRSGEVRAEAARLRAAELRAQAERIEAHAAHVDKGNTGERLTGGQLDVLSSAGWHVLNDRRKAPGSPANIDHIVVGPPGIFVVDSKHWNSKVTVDARGLTANGYRKTKEVEALRQEAMAVRLHSMSLVADAPVIPVFCFTTTVGLSEPSHVEGMWALELPALLGWLTSQPAVLTPQQVHQLGSSLDVAFPPRSAPARQYSPPATPGSTTGYRSSGHRQAPAPKRRAASRVSPGDRLKLGFALILGVLVLTGTYGQASNWFVKQVTPVLTPHPAVVPKPAPAPSPAR